MLSVRNSLTRSRPGRVMRRRPASGAVRPGDRMGSSERGIVRDGCHPLVHTQENAHLYAYESRIKEAFDAIIPTLKQISTIQHDADFEIQAQDMARDHLGFALPEDLLVDAWVKQLDMRRLFAWCIFETYYRFCDEVFTRDPLGSDDDGEFQAFLQQCGFHKLDISPCADGRLAHVIRYVLRLPYRSVRRRSYAGAIFDIEDSLEKWVRTELVRFREGKPNTSDEPTRYLKAVVYHYSSVDPDHLGCAAHGSDTTRAILGGVGCLNSFRQAVENTHCCGASIDRLLLGMDTDTDSIRIHMPNDNGDIDPENYIDNLDIYDATSGMDAAEAEQWIADQVNKKGGGALQPGMARFMAYLLIKNLSQLEYVRRYYGGHYEDAGHSERFIGVGIGFEEIQLRNLMFFSYMNTVEEATDDLDVGIQIFTGLNVSHGLPVPIVVRFDYHGNVPGARKRAEQRCGRVANALHERYRKLTERGLLHTLQVIRDIHAAGQIEILDSSVKATSATRAH